MFLFPGGSTISGYSIKGVTLDGSTNYYTYTPGLADTAAMTLSLWYLAAADNAQHEFHSNAGEYVNIRKKSDNKMQMSGNTEMSLAGETAIVIASGWTHLMIARTGTTRKMWVDGVEETLETSSGDGGNSDWTRSAATIFATPSGGSKTNADVADFWLDTAVYYSDPTLFIADGKPVDLGSDGSNPGARPDFFLHVAADGSASDFNTNLGNGPSVALQGDALSLSSTSP